MDEKSHTTSQVNNKFIKIVTTSSSITASIRKITTTPPSSSSSNNNNFNSQTTSVGTRVRSWMSGVINDMRQKKSLKKWVDSTPFATSNITPERDYVTVTNLNSIPIPSVNINNETGSTILPVQINLSISDLTEIVLKNRCRSSQELYKNVPPIIITKSETNLSSTSIGRQKIEEFYEKLNANKSRYDLLKKKQTEIKNILKKDLTNEPKDSAVTVKAVKKITIKMNSRQQELDNFEFSFDDAFFNKNNDTDDECHRNALYSNSDDDDLLFDRKLGRSSTIKTDSRCKFTLTDIGRRFSEIINDDTFEPNESNNSCPNSSSMLNNNNHQQRRDSDKLLLEAAEAPKLRAQSVPASPIPKQLHKKYLKRDTSLSESRTPRTNHQLLRDSSFQSDSSHRSSVESLLEARKPDPEIILANLGFGRAQSEDVLAKIPRRFLKPSQVRGVDTEQFLKKQHVQMQLHENSVLGYRGLIGNPHIPPSHIVAKILERFKFNERTRLYDILNLNES